MKGTESLFNACIYWTSSSLARKINRLSEKAWAPIGLAPGQAYLLNLILARPGSQPLEISEQLHLAPSTITRFIEKLEEKKLAVRIIDGKNTSVYPTPKAKAMLPEIEKCMNTFNASVDAVISKADNKKLITSMLSLSDKLGE